MTRSEHSVLRRSYRFLKHDLVYGMLLYRYGLARRDELLKKAVKSERHTYTCFYRSPGQLEALCGPVMEQLLTGRGKERFDIQVFASSTGAESYTLASVLYEHFPHLDFHITSSDLHADMIERAEGGVYSKQEVHERELPEAFLTQTFDASDDHYLVKPHLRARVSFQQANLLDRGLALALQPADIVFMQNVLCHMDVEPAKQAFWAVVPLLKERSALFIDGMSLDLRESLTLEAGLTPLDFKVREVHEFARSHIRERWWTQYYGIEPYARWRRNGLRRFSTIFLRDEAQACAPRRSSAAQVDRLVAASPSKYHV